MHNCTSREITAALKRTMDELTLLLSLQDANNISTHAYRFILSNCILLKNEEGIFADIYFAGVPRTR